MTVPKLLIVDDDPDICEMIRITFSYEYKVTAETNGRDGLERAREIRPDVLICDLVMPGLDGLTLSERVKTQYPDVIVVIITAATKNTDLPDAFWRMGTPADGFLTKPFDPQTLVSLVQDLRLKRAAEGSAGKAQYGALPPHAKDGEQE